MLTPPQPHSPLVEDWIERHRNPLNFALHIVSIPVSIIGFVLLPVGLAALSWRVAALGLGLFAVGYLGQFLGHLITWTEPGELTALRCHLQRSPRLARVPKSVEKGPAVWT